MSGNLNGGRLSRKIAGRIATTSQLSWRNFIWFDIMPCMNPIRFRLGGSCQEWLGVASVLICTFGLTCAQGDRRAQAQATINAKTETLSPAQSAPSPAVQPPLPTLHVYTNLEQIPVLVLTSDRQRMKPVDTSQFRVRLDSGRPFAPKYVRQEGDDPISLAVLIDTSRPKNELLPQLAQAIANLAPDYLHPQDLVAVYQFDCNLIRTVYFQPANPVELKDGVDKALEAWRSGGERKSSGAACKPTMPLWDSMAKALADLGQQPGRRVLLVVSDGQDDGSKTEWTQFMYRAQIESAAVFALTTVSQMQVMSAASINKQIVRHSPLMQSPEDKLDLICELSGGVEIQTERSTESWRLKEFTQMVRERYILEYPRGRDRKAGVHSLQVSLGRDDLYIRPSGIMAPVASEDEIKDSNTTPADPSRKPTEGKRKVLQPPSQ
jgi:hypothetical protein